MKRELKEGKLAFREDANKIVTRHIPMKRELKEFSRHRLQKCHGRHKAYPDEKGTERPKKNPRPLTEESVTRHIPMKRELKEIPVLRIIEYHSVTRHIPMKRELKECPNIIKMFQTVLSQGISR